jgi:hypothetical protein
LGIGREKKGRVNYKGKRKERQRKETYIPFACLGVKAKEKKN